jgi:D-alanyl-D-alanine dipeptidase
MVGIYVLDMKRKILTTFLLGGFIGLLSLSVYLPVFAQTKTNTTATPLPNVQQQAPNFNVPLPGLDLGTATVTQESLPGTNTSIFKYSSPWIARYVNWIYQAMMAAGVIFAVLMIVVGGIQYIMSGNSGGVGAAKSRIKNAFLGLTLLIMAYTVLAFINPAWTNLSFLNIVLPRISGDAAKCQKAFDETTKNMTPINGQFYCTDPKFFTVLSTYNYKNVKAGSKKAHKNAAEALKLVDAKITDLNKQTGNEISLLINGASRTLNTQLRLCTKYENCKASYGGDNSNCALATPPRCSTTGHGAGLALDVTLTGKYQGNRLTCGRSKMSLMCRDKLVADKYRKQSESNCKNDPALKTCQNLLYDIMTDANFTGINNEWWHFNISGAPTTTQTLNNTVKAGF